jgi:hypothetical protein
MATTRYPLMACTSWMRLSWLSSYCSEVAGSIGSSRRGLMTKGLLGIVIDINITMIDMRERVERLISTLKLDTLDSNESLAFV